MAETVTITAIGYRGDGIAEGSPPLYVPFTLPGERVLIEREADRGRLIEIVAASPERVAPLCRHFGTCGGCALQMMPPDRTRALKRDFVIAALAHQGLAPDVAETIGVPVANRRRAVLTALRTGKRVVLGYHERLSRRIVDIAECPVLAPTLSERLATLRELLPPLLLERKPVRMTLLLTANGIDVALEDAVIPDAKALSRLAATAFAAGIARLAVDGEPILTLAEPALDLAAVRVAPPPGAFMQASAEAEAAMTALVVEHLRQARRAADLFAGVGTFALALARHAPVRAVEASQPALDALQRATKRASRLKPIETEARDLFKDPLSADELKRFDGVVFDPPFAGAKAQAAALAASRVPRIVAVSCNPATFARDARILVDGGYTLDRVVPIDQFVYSAATEVVGLFSRSS